MRAPFDTVLSANTSHNWGRVVENIRTRLINIEVKLPTLSA